MSVLLLLCMIRGAYFCIEQPTNSCMIHFPYIVFLKIVAEKLFAWTSTCLLLCSIQ